MRRTLLMIVSVLVAATGTGTMGLWAVARSKEQPVREVAVKVLTTQPVPGGPLKGEVAVAIPVVHQGAVAGQKLDLVRSEAGRTAVVQYDALVLAVLPDGRVSFSRTEAEALELIGLSTAGVTITALLPGPRDSPPRRSPTTAAAVTSGSSEPGPAAAPTRVPGSTKTATVDPSSSAVPPTVAPAPTVTD